MQSFMRLEKTRLSVPWLYPLRLTSRRGRDSRRARRASARTSSDGLDLYFMKLHGLLEPRSIQSLRALLHAHRRAARPAQPGKCHPREHQAAQNRVAAAVYLRAPFTSSGERRR